MFNEIVLQFHSDNEKATKDLVDLIQKLAPYMVDNVSVSVYGDNPLERKA